MSVGVFIKKPENVFSNGCIQQSYYLLKQLRLTGYECHLVATEPDYTTFEIDSEPIIHVSKLDGFKLILFVSGSVSDEEGLRFLKSKNLKLVSVICGNYYVLHQEEYIFDKHHIIKNAHSEAYRKYIDQNWLLPMYAEFRDYVELMTGVKTIVTPYVWDSDAIDRYIQKNSISLEFRPQNYTNSQIMLLIFEPNMSIHKTSLVPLLQAEDFYLHHSDKLHSVHHFCTNVNESSTYLINSLKIQQDKKLTLYHRMIMPAVVASLIQANPKVIPIVLSHNFHNELNFLHLELFHLGIPVVHNCEPYRKAGKYFTTATMLSVRDHLLDLQKNISNPRYYKTYMSECRKLVNHYRPHNQQHIMEYKKHIENILK